MNDASRLSDDEARRLWQRAAELQAEAAQTLEERSRGLAARGSEGHAESGYSLVHVRQAALEAGIAPEFVDLAIAEREQDGGSEGLAGRIMGEGPRWITVSRLFDQPPATVFQSMQRVLPPLRLQLVDTQGEPLEGGWMRFDLPAVGLQDTQRLMVDLYHWADVRELHARIRPVGDGKSEVTLRAPLGYSRTMGGWILGGLAPVGGLLVAGVTGGLVAALTGGMALAPVLAWGSAAGAFGLGTAGGLKGLRALSRWGWSKGEQALDRLMGSLATDIRTGGAFQTTPLPPSSRSSTPQGFSEP